MLEEKDPGAACCMVCDIERTGEIYVVYERTQTIGDIGAGSNDTQNMLTSRLCAMIIGSLETDEGCMWLYFIAI